MGIRFSSITLAQLTNRVAEDLCSDRGGWIITANTDHLNRASRDPDVAGLYREADLVVADGMPLVWASRLRGHPLPERVAGSDLVWSLSEMAAQQGRSIYLLGGAPGAAEGAASVFKERFPTLRLAGVSAPLVDDPPTVQQIEEIYSEIGASQAEIAYVALGAPKQERLIRALRVRLPMIWWIGVGISLSFVTGHVRRAPRSMQRLGFEWVHRLIQEPRRLGRRYVVEDAPFAVRMLLTAGRERFRAGPSNLPSSR